MTGQIGLILVAAFVPGIATLANGAESASLTGNVTYSAGAPIEHATVMVYEAGVRKGYSIFCHTCYPDCGKHSLTGAAGDFKIDGLNPGLVFTLLVVKDGYSATYVRKVDSEKGPAETAVLKKLVSPDDPKQYVRGRVVVVRGDPVRDAVVEQQGVAYRAEGGGIRQSFGPMGWIDLIAVTNANGEFELAHSKPAERITFAVSPRGMSAKLFTEPTGPERKTLTVTAGATIRGRLMSDGKPVANAEIGLTTHSRISGTVLPDVRIGTREDGTFAITNVTPGRVWYLYPRMESLAPKGLAADLVECETKDDGQVVNVGEIQARPGFTLRGKVVLSDGKEIPPEMHMNVFGDHVGDSQTFVLGADGRFEFKGLARGVYDLAPSVKGYQLTDGRTMEKLIDQDVNDLTLRMLPAAKP